MQATTPSSTSSSSREAATRRLSQPSWSSATSVSSNLTDATELSPPQTPATGFKSFTSSELSSKGADPGRSSVIHPIMETQRTDPTRQQAMDALHHIERKQANVPNLISPNLGAPAATTAKPDAASILSYIQDLESQLAALKANAESPRDAYSDYRSTNSRPATSAPQQTSASKWIVEIKRFKKLNYRFGSAQLYDDSETIEAIKARESAARVGGNVLNVYREYDWEGNALNSKLEICSMPLLELIRDLIDHYPGAEFDLLRWEETAGDNVTFSEPYMMLFTHRSEMETSLKRHDIPAETKSHLRLLLDFLREEMPRTSAKLDEIEAGTCKKISFQDLWLLYPPNTPVYINVNNEDRQMVVYSRNVPEKNLKGQWGVLSLYCWSAKYLGDKLVRDFYPWVIQPFTGDKVLHQLDLVPMRYMPKQDEIKLKMIERGKRYFELNERPALQDYTGSAFPRVFKDEPIRVVVDQDTYWDKCGVDVTRHDDPSEEYGFPEGEESLEDENGDPLDMALVCCYPSIGVYSLRDKEWKMVRVEDLQPVKFREKAFKRLVIKDEYKKIIIAMVEAYMMEQPGFSDIVTGKGRGLIVLLHGPPGVGKTLTAECISEKQQRPLYSVSCGELGTDPLEIEKRLKEVFNYAVTWKAILLMDEADIFLQERDIHDVKRNALVSIFLRELEYFDGILFLTTNRPGDIDEAFHARIHVSIGLKALNSQERQQVWAVFIRDLDLSDREKRALLEHVTEQFDGDNLNGRQIRNSIRTALALAQLKGEKLRADHLDRVVKIGREFAGYMVDLNKMNAEEYAIALGRRAPTSRV